MSFAAPERLVLLAVPAAVIVGWVALRARQTRFVVRFTDLETIDRVVPRRIGWRRLVTVGGLVVGLASASVAFARPVVAVPVPQERATVILAVDVSLSMGAKDVAPSRIGAAQDAVRRFAELAPDNLRIGLVAFAGTALPVVAPTDDRATLVDAVERLGLGQGTAVGEAIFTALDQLRLETDANGVLPPSALVVLSDGETTVGRSEAEAAAAARRIGVPVYTIAFGTPAGTVYVQDRLVPVPVNQGSLRQVAEETGGAFFTAASERDLRSVLDTVGSQIAFVTEERDVTDWFALAAALAVAVAAGGSLLWFGRLEA